MPDDTKITSSKKTSPAEAQLTNVGALLEGATQAFPRWLTDMFALSQEISRFTLSRWQEDFAAWSALAACRTPDELQECQRRFAASAVAQYGDEITKLSQMLAQMGSRGSMMPQPDAGA